MMPDIRKKYHHFYLFIVHNVINLLRHELVYLIKLRFERYFADVKEASFETHPG